MSAVTDRPADFCEALLGALAAADGRSRNRKRDQTPDAVGLALRRSLLARAVTAAPAAAQFEAWLYDEAHDNPALLPAALQIHEEWLLAQRLPAFAQWLAGGARSEDAA